jgi:voltage-gated potassium channel
MADQEMETLEQQRWELLERIVNALETPMIVLGLAWLVLLVVELTWGLTPLLAQLGDVIWIIFIIDFLAEFLVAPRKRDYLKANWVVALSLALPALRVFRLTRAWRVARTVRAARGTRLVRLVTSLNRGMKALGATMGRRGFGYVVALTVIVTFAGAAGMYAFERDSPAGLVNYSAALWWTAMIMTTMGSDFWPMSPEGRLLCVGLSLYAFAVFGYVTASLASFFVDRDAEEPGGAIAGTAAVEALREEIARLRADLFQERGSRPRQ